MIDKRGPRLKKDRRISREWLLVLATSHFLFTVFFETSLGQCLAVPHSLCQTIQASSARPQEKNLEITQAWSSKHTLSTGCNLNILILDVIQRAAERLSLTDNDLSILSITTPGQWLTVIWRLCRCVAVHCAILLWPYARLGHRGSAWPHYSSTASTALQLTSSTLPLATIMETFSIPKCITMNAALF